MIQCNLLGTRSRDGIKVYTRFSQAFFDIAAHKFVSDIPAGADTANYAETTMGKVRCDQTGEIFEMAHDVEDSERTYTEVFPDPDEAVEYSIQTATGGIKLLVLNYCDYPEYKAANTYAEGDIVTYSSKQKTYISDFDGNQGNTPDMYGWSVYLPHIHNRRVDGEIEYKSLEEWEAEA